ncbi:Protein yellow [Papilio xuthus]|uniref:Protein yellow n=2 Tax=Papilio xuthus TaxID=66420 RepID=A0A194QBK4_PAPXU|nr:Protein yellow [Papilio xuthus]
MRLSAPNLPAPSPHDQLEIRGHPKNVAWSGGPLHCECEHGVDFWAHGGKYIKDNVIAIKAVSFNDNIYVITPRLKRGVQATVWQIIKGRHGVELDAFPSITDHALADCDAIQNAVDCHLDHLGNLWVLDSGIVDTIDNPRCTCPPKVVVINVVLKKVTKTIKLTSTVEPMSQLQNIVVEYTITGTYIYISDASRGAIIVHEVSSNDGWSVLACDPAIGIQLALVKRGPLHNSLMLIRIHHRGVLELDTAMLKRKMCNSPLTVIGEKEKPVFLLGFDAHHLYLRHSECADVLSWDIQKPYSNLINIHSAGPQMVPTSVTSDPLKYSLLVLDTNYAETVLETKATYHKLTFIGQV